MESLIFHNYFILKKVILIQYVNDILIMNLLFYLHHLHISVSKAW